MALAKFTDTMIGSKDLGKTVQFYKDFLGMQVSNTGDGKSFIILTDPKTNQNLCITADSSIENALPSIESDCIEDTLQNLKILGGKVISEHVYATMKVANVEDLDGRKMCVWQSLRAQLLTSNRKHFMEIILIDVKVNDFTNTILQVYLESFLRPINDQKVIYKL